LAPREILRHLGPGGSDHSRGTCRGEGLRAPCNQEERSVSAPEPAAGQPQAADSPCLLGDPGAFMSALVSRQGPDPSGRVFPMRAGRRTFLI